MKQPYSATGHRPNKLYNAYPETKGYKLLVEFAQWMIQQRAEEISYILTGMAIGWDMAISQACINLNIPFTACVPFLGQATMWPDNTKRYYANLLAKAKEVVYVCDPGYAAWKMQMRNQYMVDNSAKVLALWDGTSGGTANCVEYAKTKDVKIINCWAEYIKCLNYYGIKL